MLVLKRAVRAEGGHTPQEKTGDNENEKMGEGETWGGRYRGVLCEDEHSPEAADYRVLRASTYRSFYIAILGVIERQHSQG